MEPLSDRELDELLAAWEAPEAPATLTRRLQKARRGDWSTGWWTASIRVPVPVTLLALVALCTLFVMALEHRSLKVMGPVPKAAGLQPVKRLELRVIRTRTAGDQE